MHRSNQKRRIVLKCMVGAGMLAAHPAYVSARAAFKYRLGLNQPVGSPTHVRMVEMAKAIQEESGGALQIDVYPNSMLGSDNEMLKAVRSGELEFYVAGNNLGTVAEVSELPSLPYIFDDNASVFRALDGELGNFIRQQLESQGLHAFHYMANGFHHLTSSVGPIATAADLRGVKMRTPIYEMPADFFRLYGAEPKGITFNKMYEALRDGVVDAQTDPHGVSVSLKLYEVQKYLSLTNHWWSGFMMVANPSSWKRLPSDLQEMVTRKQRQHALLQREEVDAVNRNGVKFLTSKGMIVNDVDTESFRRQLGGFYEKWRRVYGAEAWLILRRYAPSIG